MTTNAETTTTNETAGAAEQGAPVAPEKASSKKGASQKKGAPKGQKSAKGSAQPTTPFDGPEKAAKTSAKAKASKKAGTTKKAPKREPKAKGTRDGGNKKAEVVGLMKRAKGVTLAEIREATGWQSHTVRGFVSLLGSKGGEKIESTKNAAGERTYHIAK